MALMCWVIGAVISTCRIFVMLEFGSAIPRSGGIKNYLERSFNPRLMQTCIYVFYCVFMQVSASNAIAFSSYILDASGAELTTWKLCGVAITGAVFAVGLHTVAPRIGRRIQDMLSADKLFTLLFIVCCGVAALAGNLRVERPNNFTNSFEDTSSSGYSIGTAILNVIFSFQGYDNVNAVGLQSSRAETQAPTNLIFVGVIRSPQSAKDPHNRFTSLNECHYRTISVGKCFIQPSLTYSKFAAVPKEVFIAAKVTVAATLFENIFGPSAGVRALPALVALSALGHLLGVAFTIR
ncbi:amino acid/polyamine transporter I [Colletotrichum cereale]|nr:amino acid/polyamine transporter I [Colletotrichum cereale]